ncbi:hypothetical protein ACM43_10130, partial [Bradyrhizobium sp. CCBAU 45321]|uniref:hypothetical protein n=1 Tax=Bradyrhizobium sp. CCBAU 45321 TaxID=1641878 RepID=UPI0023042E48
RSISHNSLKPEPSPDQKCERFWTVPINLRVNIVRVTQLPKVIAGVKFIDAIEVIPPNIESHAA